MLKKYFLVTLLTLSLPTKTDFFTYKNGVRSLAIGMALTGTYLAQAVIINKYLTLKGFQDLNQDKEERIFEGLALAVFGLATASLFAHANNIK